MGLLTPSFGLLFWTIFFFAAAVAVFFILLSMWRRNDIPQNTKILWAIFIVIAPIIGFLCYLIFGFPNEKSAV